MNLSLKAGGLLLQAVFPSKASWVTLIGCNANEQVVEQEIICFLSVKHKFSLNTNKIVIGRVPSHLKNRTKNT